MIFEQVATGEPYAEFLTIPAYERLLAREASVLAAG